MQWLKSQAQQSKIYFQVSSCKFNFNHVCEHQNMNMRTPIYLEHIIGIESKRKNMQSSEEISWFGVSKS